jgi:hypothetical protein
MIVTLKGGPLDGMEVRVQHSRSPVVIDSPAAPEGYMFRYENKYDTPRDVFTDAGIIAIAERIR